MQQIQELREKRAKAWDAAKAFLDTKRGNDGLLSEEDVATYEKMETAVVNLGKEIDRLTRQNELDAELNKPTAEPLTTKPMTFSSEAKAGRSSDEYRNNFCDMRENYHTAGLTCRMDNVSFGNLKTASKSSSNLRDPIAWWDCYEANQYPSACTVTEADPIFFDFGSAKACNRLKIEINTVPAAQIDNLKIQYSNDNSVWADVPGKSRSSQVWSFTLTSARYWRIFIPSYSWSYSLANTTTTRDEQAFGTTFFLGKTVPGLKFTVPPASGAAIEASYQLELPFKTSNNLLRFTCSLLLSKGEGS